MGELFAKVLPEDLLEFGLIPEFIGRLPVISNVHQLRKDDLVDILTEPKNALTKQYHKFFGYDGVDLIFAKEALDAIADQALKLRDRRARPALHHRSGSDQRDVRAAQPPRRDQVRGHP